MRIKGNQLPEENKAIMASKYQLYLPAEKQLLTEIKREINELDEGRMDAAIMPLK